MSEETQALAREWKRLARAATFVALLTSPVLFGLLYYSDNWSLGAAIGGTIFGVIAFRGLIDILAHKLIPRPSLQGADAKTGQDDASARRRLWFWRGKYRFVIWFGGSILLILFIIATIAGESIGTVLSDI